MEQRKKATPFGLFYEEPASQPQSHVIPTYDEETDLSYLEDQDGSRVPYVEITSNICTETQTRIADEAPDEDENYISQFAGTHTVTKMELEPTDPDPADDPCLTFGNAATQTATAIEAESSDTDPGDDEESSIVFRRPLAATTTFTEQDRESTDTD